LFVSELCTKLVAFAFIGIQKVALRFKKVGDLCAMQLKSVSYQMIFSMMCQCFIVMQFRK